ncbi:MAG: phosphatidate cytidylyltransferase [Thiohalobacteraceae bacterium]
MLKRLLTAVVLMPLVVLAILRLPTPGFEILAGLFLLLGLWEWTGLIPMRNGAVKAAYLLAFAILAGAAWWMLQDQTRLLVWLLAVIALWWLVAAAWLGRPQLGRDWRSIKVLLPALVLVPTWLALGHLHGAGAQGPQWVLFIVVLMWVADSAAYFSGKSLGRHKLAPRVSPGKTWEGAIGGLVGGALFALAAGSWFGWAGNRLLGFTVLAIICVAISIVGDLFISLLKRQQGLKDTGNLFPGHGGMLDRIDSLLAAVPVFALGMSVGLNSGLGGLEG